MPLGNFDTADVVVTHTGRKVDPLPSIGELVDLWPQMKIHPYLSVRKGGYKAAQINSAFYFPQPEIRARWGDISDSSTQQRVYSQVTAMLTQRGIDREEIAITTAKIKTGQGTTQHLLVFKVSPASRPVKAPKPNAKGTDSKNTGSKRDLQVAAPKINYGHANQP